MKKIIFFLFTINCFSQVPTVEWQKCLGGSNNEEARCVKKTSDGGYIVGAYTFSNDGQVSGLHGSIEDFWVVKLAADGTIQWQKTYGGNGDEEIYSISQTNDGGYIVAGYATYPNSGDVTGIHSSDYREDFWVIKISSTGTLEWQKTLGGTLNDVAKDIKQTADGGYIVIGKTLSNNFDVSGLHGNYHDIWVVKLSTTGTIVWQKTYGGTSYEYGYSIVQSDDGGYVFTGDAQSSDGDLSGIQAPTGNGSLWVVKINNVGIIQWQKIISNGGNISKINKTNNGEYIILCAASASGDFSGSTANALGNTGIVKLSSSGTIIWAKVYGDNNGYINFGNVVQSIDGNYVFATTIVSANGNVETHIGQNDLWIVKINQSNGNIIWQKTVGRADASETCWNLETTNDNGYIISGNVISTTGFPGYNGGGSDCFVVKLSADGLSTSDFQPNELSLFPNPSSNLLNIKTTNDFVLDKLIVTDLSGKVILVQSENTNQINTENLATGTYFIQAFSGQNKYQTKFIKE